MTLTQGEGIGETFHQGQRYPISFCQVDHKIQENCAKHQSSTDDKGRGNQECAMGSVTFRKVYFLNAAISPAALCEPWLLHIQL